MKEMIRFEKKMASGKGWVWMERHFNPMMKDWVAFLSIGLPIAAQMGQSYIYCLTLIVRHICIGSATPPLDLISSDIEKSYSRLLIF